MRTTINWKTYILEGVELAHVNELLVSFRIYANEPHYWEYLEILIENGADVSLHVREAYVIVKREDVKTIMY